MADSEERGFLAALKANAKDVATRLAYADWLEEHDRPYEAVLQRVKAGVSEVRYKVRRKSDGRFSNGRGGFSARGKEWLDLRYLRDHFSWYATAKGYNGVTDYADLEVVVVELRIRDAAALALTFDATTENVVVHEPKGDAAR